MYLLRKHIQRPIQRSLHILTRSIQRSHRLIINMNLITRRIHLVAARAQHTCTRDHLRCGSEMRGSEVDGGGFCESELACWGLGGVSRPGRCLEAGDVLWEGTSDSGCVCALGYQSREERLYRANEKYYVFD